MKTALVLEGGAMRGLYTAGVLDVFMDNDIHFDAVIGVSAGALFGVNLLSKQRGRVVRYNKKYNGSPNYMGVRPLLTTGNIINTELAYVKVPYEYDPFDDETYKKSEVPFYAVVTNINTAEPEYIRISSIFDQMDTLRASGSMPFVSQPVNINGNEYLDGAVTDSIPFEKMLEMGYDRLVVVLTKPKGYIKKSLPKALANICYKKKYPKFYDAVVNRHIMYNGQINRLIELENEGKAIVIRPSKNIKISKIEKKPEKIQEMYDLGLLDAKDYIDSIKSQIL